VDACRACGGATTVVFETTILGRYPVNFLKCQVCESLQPKDPFWIAESYSNAIAATDTGAMVRNLQCQAAVYAVAVCCRASGRFLDFGGGAGVLCRLLRDHGFDAFVTDKYAEPVFARAFSISLDECQGGEFALVSAVEVLEHLEDPAREIGRLFALQPDVVVATTQVYQGQGKDWWYLSAQTGQHVFFYSKRCLEQFAQKYGFYYLDADWIHVFSAKPLGMFRRVALRFSLSNLGLGMIRLWLAVRLRGRNANRDHTTLCGQLAARQAERPNE
jgi:2-polyprenyl-3-methyl-5-hydroxy-6-metoxy-1,4-benzoquinol methylase